MKRLLICLHDVCPENTTAVRVIMDRLEPVVGQAIASAVIPRSKGHSWSESDEALAREVDARSGEILLHGMTHWRPGSLHPLSLLSGWCDEMAALPRREAERRLKMGRADLVKLFGRPPEGFVPPAWRAGPVDAGLLRDLGIGYLMRPWSIEMSSGAAPLPLTTWSWDWGAVGKGGRWLAPLCSALMGGRGAIPCVVFHPLDLDRGLLELGLKKVQRLMDRGYTPALPRELISGGRPSEGSSS